MEYDGVKTGRREPMGRAYHVHGMENRGWNYKKSEKGVYLAHYLSPPPPGDSQMKVAGCSWESCY